MLYELWEELIYLYLQFHLWSACRYECCCPHYSWSRHFDTYENIAILDHQGISLQEQYAYLIHVNNFSHREALFWIDWSLLTFWVAVGCHPGIVCIITDLISDWKAWRLTLAQPFRFLLTNQSSLAHLDRTYWECLNQNKVCNMAFPMHLPCFDWDTLICVFQDKLKVK
jgi:hypothetical protein